MEKLTKNARNILAGNLRRIINERETGVREIAAESGMSKEHLYKILRCEVDVSFAKLDALAAALERSIEDLFSQN